MAFSVVADCRRAPREHLHFLMAFSVVADCRRAPVSISTFSRHSLLKKKKKKKKNVADRVAATAVAVCYTFPPRECYEQSDYSLQETQRSFEMYL
jgi:hypothetical protein